MGTVRTDAQVEPASDALLERVTRERATALAALAVAADGDSLCTIDRERLPAAKYHEGAVAALGDALRAIRASGQPPRAARWGSEWARRAEADAAWRAYVRGGRDALERLRSG